VTGQYCPRIRQEIAVVLEPAREAGERLADIAGDDREQRPCGRGEETDVEVGIQEECRHVGAVEKVLEVPGPGALSIDSRPEFAVEGGELLVARF
jgi:hypothetical protein